MPDNSEPPVRTRPGPPQGRFPKMFYNPWFMVGAVLILIAMILAGFYA